MSEKQYPYRSPGRPPGKIDKALDMLEYIKEYKAEHDGNSPSYREIMDGTGIVSTSVVTYYLSQLQDHGHIRIDPRLSRSIEVVGGSWSYAG